MGTFLIFFHMPDVTAIRQASELDLGLFLTQPPTEQVTGDKAAKMLMTYWSKAVEKFPAINAQKESFSESLDLLLRS